MLKSKNPQSSRRFKTVAAPGYGEYSDYWEYLVDSSRTYDNTKSSFSNVASDATYATGGNDCVIKMWNPYSYNNAQIVNDRGTFGFYKERRT